jgi:predicted small metal-binding protein
MAYMRFIYCVRQAGSFSTNIQIYCSNKFRRNPLSSSAREVIVLLFEHSRHQHNVQVLQEKMFSRTLHCILISNLKFILLMCTLGRAPNNASKWEMGFNSVA